MRELDFFVNCLSSQTGAAFKEGVCMCVWGGGDWEGGEIKAGSGSEPA